MLDVLQQIDSQILNIVREAALSLPWIHIFIRVFADLEPLLFWILLVLLWMYGVSEKSVGPKQVALDLFWHVMLAFAVYWIINQSLPMRPRPESIATFPPLISHIPDNSFPSGHALFWWASWWALHTLLGKKKITWTFFVVGFLTVCARVIAGIHYPGDIVVGFLLGWGLIAIITHIPHPHWYQQYGHALPIKIASFFRL